MGKIKIKIILTRPASNLKKTIPLGLLYLATYIKKKMPSCSIKIIDLRLKKDLELLKQTIDTFCPDVIGISVLSCEAKNLQNMIKLIREHSISKIIVGGPYATESPIKILETVDYCITGEGEKIFSNLIQTLSENRETSSLKGIAYKDSKGMVKINPAEETLDVSELPIPDYSLINVKEYHNSSNHSAIVSGYKAFPIFTSRGCPYDCIFCCHAFGKKFRARSVESVISEIRYLYENYNMEELHIEDDSFNLDIGRAKEIMRKIITLDYKLKIAFPNGLRADFIDDELMSLMKKAGVYQVIYGIESFVPRIRNFIHKNLDTKKIEDAILLARKYNILVYGFIMTGFPTETKEEFDENLRLILKSKLDIMTISKVVVFKGTKLYEYCVKNGIQVPYDVTDNDYFFEKTNFNLNNVSLDYKNRKIRNTYLRFYLNPRRFFRIIKLLPNRRKLLINGFIFLTKLI